MLLFTPLLLTAATSTPSDPIRSSAEAGLALLQASQKNWNQSCSSCHQQLLPAMAFRAALLLSFSIYSDLDRAVQHAYVIDPAMDDAFDCCGLVRRRKARRRYRCLRAARSRLAIR